MQDYNYVWGGCFEITLELSCCKYPYKNELARYWQDNKKALLTYLGEVHRGVRGLVVDINGNPVSGATLKIKDREINFKPSKKGEFWRILLPGVYTIEAYANGYHPLEMKFTVQEGQPTFIQLQLAPIEAVSTINQLTTQASLTSTNQLTDDTTLTISLNEIDSIVSEKENFNVTQSKLINSFRNTNNNSHNRRAKDINQHSFLEKLDFVHNQHQVQKQSQTNSSYFKSKLSNLVIIFTFLITVHVTC